LGQAIADMRGVEAADPRLVLEVALVRLSRREAGPPIQTVIERIERLERAQGERTGTAPVAPETPARRSRRPTVGALRRDAERAPDGTEPSDRGPGIPARSEATQDGASPPAAGDAMEEGAPLDLDDVILAWAAIVPELTPATRSAVQNAQPVRYDGDVLVFGVAPELLGAARERFKREADTVRDALAAKLGQRFKFTLVADPTFSLRDRPTEPPDEDEVDLGAAHDAEQAVAAPPPPEESASVNRLREELGATVVEELPREA
jgi:hypothetical protein